MVLMLFFVFLNLFFVLSIGSKSFVSHEKGIDIINLDEKDTDQMLLQMHEQALSSVMAIIASRNTKYLKPKEMQRLEKCSSDADTLQKHAKCVIQTMSLAKARSNERKKIKMSPNLEEMSKRLLPPKFKSAELKIPTFNNGGTSSTLKTISKIESESKIVKNKKKVTSKRFKKLKQKKLKKSTLQRKMAKTKPPIIFRSKRDSIFPKFQNANDYKLQKIEKMSPIGGFARFFLNGVLELKNKTSSTPWQNLVEDIRKTGVERKKTRMRGRQRSERTEIDFLEDLALNSATKDRFYPDEIIEKMIKDPYFKNVQRKEAMKKSPVKKALGLMRDGLKLAYVMAGKNVTNFDDKTVKVASPRFFSVTPDEDITDPEDTIDILSPSLLSLHSDGSGVEKDFSIPNLIRGFTTIDQQMWLDFIFEASGVEEAAQEAAKAIAAQEFQVTRKKRYQDTMVNDENKPLYLTKEEAVKALGGQTKQNIEQFEGLMNTITPEQMRKINETGYFVMTPEQLKMVYGNGSTNADSERLQQFLKLNESQIHAEIDSTVYAIAEGRTQRRKRTIVGTPFAFTSIIFDPVTASQPIILSPIIFTWVVGSPAVLGPIILGPWAFLPLILSPRILSPAILNPFLFVPIILSPLALHPAILCPGIFNPLVLSPLLMTPFILSPQVFTPLILSPLCLNPFILTPTVGGPLVLSPFVLTPVILSPLTLFALVLSPNALSPIIESKLYLAELVLSPSWLS